MHHGALAGAEFDGGDPGVLFKGSRDGDVEPLDQALGGDLVGRHVDDDFGLDLPAFGPLLGRRGVLRVAFGGAGVGPLGEGLDVGGREAGVVLEVAVAGVGEPGRHFLGDYGGLDGFGPGAGAFVGEERHRGGFAGAVAGLAVALEDRLDVFVEGLGGGGYR